MSLLLQLHTSQLNDSNEDRYALTINSVTDQDSLQDFLATAEMAGRDFTAGN